MISIIICSRVEADLKLLSSNIETTIGVDFEIIAIDNSDNQFSICSAYNTGAAKAIYPYLCFVHEDVKFITQSWGVHLIRHMDKDSKIGLIGLAGSVYKSRMCSGWWQSEPGWKEIRRMNMIQHHKKASQPSKHIQINPCDETTAEVVTVDGVMMFIKKTVWQQCLFSDQLLTGFHGYDFDFSMQVNQHYKNVVVYDVLLEHFSAGSYDSSWIESMIAVHKKWSHMLPINLAPSSPALSNVYMDGWKRLRKNLSFSITQNISLAKLLAHYNFYFSSLEHKPSFLKLQKDYLKGFFRLLVYYKARKFQQGQKVVAK